MAKVVLGVGTSHGPSIQSPPEHMARLGEGDKRDPRFDYQAALRRARPGLEAEIAPDLQKRRHAAARAALHELTRVFRDSKLDAVVVVSNQHRVRPADQHPVFGVLRAASLPVAHRTDQPMDPDSRFVDEDKRPKDRNVTEKPGHPDLANHLIETLIADGFDVACTDTLPEGVALDDAFAFPYDWLFGGAPVPLVPFYLSRDLPNQATPARCHALGAALRRAVESWKPDLRVGLIASGGLSHQIVDEELDRGVIDALVGGNAAALRALSRERLNAAPGTPEILNWVAVSAAMAPTVMTLVDYLPCYRSLAGTGHGLTFGYWR